MPRTIRHGNIEITISSPYGVDADESRAFIQIENLLNLSADPDEITEALRIADEGTDQTNGACRIAEDAHEAIRKMPQKPLKADLQKFFETIKESVENSLWEA